MKHMPPPSGITRGLDFLIPDDWSAEQALAVVELIDDLRERICAHYQIPLQELLREQRASTHEPTGSDDQTPF